MMVDKTKNIGEKNNLMHHCCIAKPLLLNANPFLDPKLEVYGEKNTTKTTTAKQPWGDASQLVDTFYFLLILFLFYSCTALNI